MRTPTDGRPEPAGGYGAEPGGSLQSGAAPPPPSSWLTKVVVAIVLLAIALVPVTILGCERRITVIADDTNVYIHAVPGDDVKFRLKEDAPFDVAAIGPLVGYTFTAPIPLSARPARGKMPIQIQYRTWAGFRRTTWLALDVDEEQLRYFFMGMWSGGWNAVARFGGDGKMTFDVPNERCIRWRYGFDGAPLSRELPEGARELEVPAAVGSVTFEPVLCKQGHPTCKVTVSRAADVTKRCE